MGGLCIVVWDFFAFCFAGEWAGVMMSGDWLELGS